MTNDGVVQDKLNRLKDAIIGGIALKEKLRRIQKQREERKEVERENEEVERENEEVEREERKEIERQEKEKEEVSLLHYYFYVKSNEEENCFTKGSKHFTMFLLFVLTRPNTRR